MVQETSPSAARSQSAPPTPIIDPAVLEQPPQPLRLGVTKRLLSRGDGPEVRPPYALISANFRIVTIAPESTGAQPHGSRHQPPPPGTQTLVETMKNHRMMLGMDALNRGIEIALATMRGGEAALFELPSALFHSEGVRDRMEGACDALFEVQVNSVTNGELLASSTRTEVVKFIESAPAIATENPHPPFESVVKCSIRQGDGAAKFQSVELEIGSENSSWGLDVALQSMMLRETATVYVNKMPTFIMLTEMRPLAETHFREQEGAESVICLIADPNARVQQAELRVAAATRLLNRGDTEMAMAKFERAACYLTAEPCIVAQPGPAAQLAAQVYIALAQCKVKLNEAKAVGSFASRALQFDGINVQALLLRARSNRLLKNFEEAAKDIARAKEVHKGTATKEIAEEESDLASAVAAAQ